MIPPFKACICPSKAVPVPNGITGMLFLEANFIILETSSEVSGYVIASGMFFGKCHDSSWLCSKRIAFEVVSLSPKKPFNSSNSI